MVKVDALIFTPSLEMSLLNNGSATLRQLHCAQRQAILERLGLTLERNAAWAGERGDDALELVMRSVGTALMAVAGDLASTDVTLAEAVAVRAIGLITTFHSRYPDYPVGPSLH
jgi:hypothetical protein